MGTTQKQLRFDYKAALADLIMPVLKALSADALWIYGALCSAKYKDLHQGQDLDVPMPEELRERFEAIPPDRLAYAARVLYFHGHWGGTFGGAKDNAGGYWKFANLADQVLSKAIGLERSRHSGSGWSWKVLEGCVRLQLGTAHLWTWQELGPATPENMAKFRERAKTLPNAFAGTDKAAEALETMAAAMRADLSADWNKLLDTKSYMREEGKCSDDCPECGRPQIWNDNARLNHSEDCSHFPIIEVTAEAFETIAFKLLAKLAPKEEADNARMAVGPACAIRSALQSLERAGYLKPVPYQETKEA
jgi:hypothetical protein